MTDQENVILKRILDHFKIAAPKIVNESVESLSTDHPIIDLYDIDYYMDKMKGVFDDVEDALLRKVAFDNIEEINTIFFNLYKKAKGPMK
ncbi:MAG: hypothetical protein GY757_16605 [bacterium]|nr:hypothetical protein [bacterium]